jgi:hypothetical protein
MTTQNIVAEYDANALANMKTINSINLIQKDITEYEAAVFVNMLQSNKQFVNPYLVQSDMMNTDIVQTFSAAH